MAASAPADNVESTRLLAIPAFLLSYAVLAVPVWPSPAAAADPPAVTWKQLSPSDSPSSRTAPAMTYDPVSRKILLFGGYDGSNYLNDTWTFDGKEWAEVTTAVAPPPRSAAGMAFDRVTRTVLLFGGAQRGTVLGDTWIWDGSSSSWIQANPRVSPKAVTLPMVFTDPRTGHVMDFGGFDTKFYQDTTYRWTGSNWHKLNLKVFPSARATAATGLDSFTKTVVMFDGLADVNPYNTWSWNGTSWAEQSPQTQPESRYYAGAAYDSHLQGLVVFGGGHAGVDVSDTWLWKNATWEQLTPFQSPVAREGYGMAFDPLIGHIVLFGGQSGNGATLYNDTWEFLP